MTAIIFERTYIIGEYGVPTKKLHFPKPEPKFSTFHLDGGQEREDTVSF